MKQGNDDCAAEWDFIKSDFNFATILVVFLMHYYKIWNVFEQVFQKIKGRFKSFWVHPYKIYKAFSIVYTI